MPRRQKMEEEIWSLAHLLISRLTKSIPKPRNIVTLFKILDECTWQGREGGVRCISTHYIAISHVEKNGEMGDGLNYIKKMV